MASLKQPTPPTSLTLHGIKKLCESRSLAAEFHNVSVVVQVVDVTIFGAENAKKNIKAKVNLSDGVSKMICMIPDRVHASMVSNISTKNNAGEEIRKYDIWVLNAGKQMIQDVASRKVMVLKTAPEVHGRDIQTLIGKPVEFSKNVENGDFPSYYDLKIPGAARKSPAAKSDHDIDDADIAGALADNGREYFEQEESKVGKRYYESTGQLARTVQAAPSEMYMPIKALNQFCNDWVIKARVVKKCEVRSWKNARGEGQLFNMDLIDRDGTLIQATAFNETAIKLAEMLEQDKVYTFCNGTVKLANKRFTSIKNDYCLTFDYGTVIEPCMDDEQITGDGFCFTKLEELESIVQNCTVDVIGVVLEIGGIFQITLRDGSQRAKRSLSIGDESNLSISVTLWGDTCEAQNYQVGQIIAFKACRVSDFNGKSLNASNALQDIVINLRHPRALDLRKWLQVSSAYDMKSAIRSLTNSGEIGNRDQVITIDELVRFCQVDEAVQSGKAFFCSLNVELNNVFMPENFEKRGIFYLACPDCKRKVIDDGHGYQCERCNKCHPEARPTYAYSFRASDCHGSAIFSCFGDDGEVILAKPAAQMYLMREDFEGMKALNIHLQGTPMKLTVRAKQDESGYSQEEDGSASIRFTVVRATRLESCRAENLELLKRLQLYKAMN